jgi:hypothetical protein
MIQIDTETNRPDEIHKPVFQKYPQYQRFTSTRKKKGIEPQTHYDKGIFYEIEIQHILSQNNQ